MATAKKLPNPAPQAPWGEYVPGMGPMDGAAFAQLPAQDGWIFELHQGRLIRMPGPGGKHGDIQTQLIWLIQNFLNTHKLGKITSTACYYLPMPNGGEAVLCPDLSYALLARKTAAPYRGSYQELVPDFVIEIASPNDTRPQLAAKVRVYLAAGVRLIWVVWPESALVEVWRPGNVQPAQVLSAQDAITGEEVIPGLTLAVRDIFN